ncbi:MAG: type II toxin-antitoxin system PemK/MazF family toxin [Firmicutes bacterium]|nr:type II toxin-antitoxin system PemK/MazF family toxin [Bacillota bacterium]
MGDIEIKRGEVWIADLSPARGREQQGTRPVLVISDDGLNNSGGEISVVLPITSRNRKFPLHVNLLPPEGGVKIESMILCNMIRSISHERFIEKLGAISSKTLMKVEETVRLILSI